MKLSRVAIIGVSALALVAGVFLGLSPIKTSMTQISPEIRELSVSCGNGYLGITPPVRADGVVEVPGEPGVFLPGATYDTRCGDAVGWRRIGAWVLTALGALGLAITFAGAGTASSPGSSRRSAGGGAHRARPGGSGASVKPETPDEPANSSGRRIPDGGGPIPTKADLPDD